MSRRLFAWFGRMTDPNGELFQFLPTAEIHLHDHFVDRVFLRFLPARVTPNMITTMRCILTPLVIVLVLSRWYLVGIIAFFFVASTDFLDGSLARTRHQITRFGMLFDPFADKLLIGSMVIILVFQHLSFWIGISILILEVIFMITALVAQISFHTTKMANIWGKIKMFCQVIAVFVTCLALVFQFPLLFTIATWIFGIAIGFALLSLFTHSV